VHCFSIRLNIAPEFHDYNQFVLSHFFRRVAIISLILFSSDCRTKPDIATITLAAETLALFVRIQAVLGPNLGPETGDRLL
jgi:hypothetical protein